MRMDDTRRLYKRYPSSRAGHDTMNTRTLHLRSERATQRLGHAIGTFLRPPDTVLLQGELGSGKTSFARGLIRSLLYHPEDIPSPTFNLIQIYETLTGELWHIDLYRIRTSNEIDELGLIDAFSTSICVIEWPDRLGSLTPQSALTLELAPSTDNDGAREVTLSWTAERWTRPLLNIGKDAIL